MTRRTEVHVDGGPPSHWPSSELGFRYNPETGGEGIWQCHNPQYGYFWWDETEPLPWNMAGVRITQAIGELNPELDNYREEQIEQATTTPTIEETLPKIIPYVPPYNIPLGIAPDGYPITLDLSDRDKLKPTIIVASQPRTDILHFVAQAASIMTYNHFPYGLDFGIVTANPDNWGYLARAGNCAGIYPAYDNAAQDFILGLVSWAHGNRNDKRQVLLLLDDLPPIVNKLDFDARQNLQWLLRHGPRRNVHPIATMNTSGGFDESTHDWLAKFPRKIVGDAPPNLVGIDPYGQEFNFWVPQ